MALRKTTVRLPADLLGAAKHYASANGVTLSTLIEKALEEKLGRETKPFTLITFKGGGLQPGVNLDSNAELLDLMEEGLDIGSRR